MIGLANLLTSYESTSKLSIAILNPQVPSPLDALRNYENQNKLPSARAYALSPASMEILGKANLDKIKSMGRLAPYKRMQVWESNGPATIHFSNKDIPNGYRKKALGCVIEDAAIVSSLWETLHQQDNNIQFLCPGSLERVLNPTESTGSGANNPLCLRYKNTKSGDSHTISTNLLVAADGGNSFTRSACNIPRFTNQYGRRAVTFTVEVSKSLGQTAFQRFFPAGPIALLPIWGDKCQSDDGPIYANIVWSTTPEHAAYLSSIDESDLILQLNSSLQQGPETPPSLFSSQSDSSFPNIFSTVANEATSLLHAVNNGLTMSKWSEDPSNTYFATPPPITKIIGPRMSFDLTLSQAKNYVMPRVALVGDAAHTIHPMAGQGLNLGLGDVSVLAREIRRAQETGMDFSGGPNNLFLSQYEKERQLASSLVMGGIQFLHWSFGFESGLGINSRSIGMNLIGAVGPARRKLVDIATTGGGIL